MTKGQRSKQRSRGMEKTQEGAHRNPLPLPRRYRILVHPTLLIEPMGRASLKNRVRYLCRTSYR